MKPWKLLLLAAASTLALAGCSSDGDSDPCDSSEGGPVSVVLESNFEFGNTRTIFRFDATGSRDQDCASRALSYRWDTNGDGVYDTAPSSDGTLELSFATTGMRTIKVEVGSDGAGKHEAEASLAIEVVDREYAAITTWLGTGIAGQTGDGTLLHETELFTPQDMSFAPSGKAYVLDWNNHRVLRTDGARSYNVCGTGTLGDAPEGSASGAGLNHPTHIAFDAQGRLIMAAWHNSMIMRIDEGADSMVRLAGRRPILGTTSNRCYSASDEGNAAVESCLDLPIATAFDSQGRLYISDQKNIRIARVDPVDGEITDNFETGDKSTFTTIAGIAFTVGGQVPLNGGFNGNDIPATEAWLSAPGGQSADPTSRIVIHDDVLYLADTQNHQIRKIDLSVANPNIELVAGKIVGNVPLADWSGDGGQATDAALNRPIDVDLDSEGNVFIADTFNNAIRRVDATTGIIETLVGTTFADPCAESETFPCELDLTDGHVLGDGKDPKAAYLARPYGIALDADDNLYIVDTYHHRIRVVYK